MATEIHDEVWAKFLDQHNSIVLLLDSHASLLVEMRKICEDNSATRGLLMGRLNTTERLIATFKQSTESLQDITKRDEPVIEEDSKIPEPEIPAIRVRATKKPKSQKSAKVVPDPSGFFTIDPNPTPVEELYKEKKPGKEKPTIAVNAKDQSKRKIEADHPPRPQHSIEEEPKRKKTKKNHGQEAPPPPTVEDEKEEEPDEQAPDDDDDSFVKAVEARSKAKEEKKKTKAEKKRKRESEDLTEGANGVTKKKKDKHESKAEAVPSESTAKAPAATNGKQKQQQNQKRPFAKADAEERDEIDENDGPARKRKRARSRASKA